MKWTNVLNAVWALAHSHSNSYSFSFEPILTAGKRKHAYRLHCVILWRNTALEAHTALLLSFFYDPSDKFLCVSLASMQFICHVWKCFFLFLQINIYIVLQAWRSLLMLSLWFALIETPALLFDACARAMLTHFEFHYYQNWKLNRQKSRQSAMFFARVSCSTTIHFLSQIISERFTLCLSTSKYLESKEYFV